MKTSIINTLKFSVLIYLLFAVTGAMANNKKVSPESVAGTTTIPTAEAKRLFDRGTVFIDVRRDRKSVV